MKFSHTITDFEYLITKGYYYIDRTPYIEKLESADQMFVVCLRPRGFDRKLFISMLSCYYGIEHKTKFHALFDKLYIGHHPTYLANRYYIIRFDFSSLDTSSSTQVLSGFLNQVKVGIGGFIDRYLEIPLKEKDGILSSNEPKEIFGNLVRLFFNKNIYILVNDCYNFIIDILEANENKTAVYVPNYSFVDEFCRKTVEMSAQGIVDKILVVGIDNAEDRGKKDLFNPDY